MHRRLLFWLWPSWPRSFALCCSAAVADSTIKVGFPMALSGPAALYRPADLQRRRDVRGGAQRQGRRAWPQAPAAAARHQGQRRRSGARLARADPQGQRRLPGRLLDLRRSHRRSRPSPRRTRSSSSRRRPRRSSSPMRRICIPMSSASPPTTDIEGRAAADMMAKWAREAGRHHRPRLCVWARHHDGLRRAAEEASSPTSRSSISNGPSSARPTSRRSSPHR